MEGTVIRIEDRGTIVIVWVDADPDDTEARPLYFDHRAFAHAYEGGLRVGSLVMVSEDHDSIELLTD